MNARTAQTTSLAVLGAILLAACAAKPGLESPVRDVGGTQYYTVTARAAETGSFDFTKKLAWLSAVSELSRARSVEAYARLTRDQRADLNLLFARSTGDARRHIGGLVDFIEEATSSSPLRNVHELQVRREGDDLVLTLGIPLDTWRELVDDAAREMAWMSQGQVLELDRRQRRFP